MGAPRSAVLALTHLTLAVLLTRPGLAEATPPEAFSPGKAAFSIKVKGESIPYEIFSLFVMPREDLTIEAQASTVRELAMVVEGEPIKRSAPTRWKWRAAATAGLTVLEFKDVATGKGVTLNVFVMVPASAIREGHLNGYRIGQYPSRPFRNLSAYRPPRGFVEVTEANRDTPVSPHFTLGQFLCKQASESPKYLVLRERLLLKLEYLLQLVNQRGYRADTLAVLSGFRTPFYNQAIGNARYSRHQWGGAADVFVDQAPKDGVMDDLNGDGRVDVDDADVLYELLENASRSTPLREMPGGLGLYGSSPVRGPFVHVDARGYRARWGRN